MKRYLRWIVAAEFLFAAGNLHAVEVEVPGGDAANLLI
ncbi:curli production assembly/transport component [Escherichia coli]|nr:curli production assembly/transport component [Escherichia coli]